MSEAQPEDWQQRIRTIASGLLTLEINTIQNDSISASKMPDLPLALHNIADYYLSHLDGLGFHVTDKLLDKAHARVQDGNDTAIYEALLTWCFRPADTRSPATTNGARTFEALHWTARAAQDKQRSNDPRLQRIIYNSRELRQVALSLAALVPNGADRLALFDGTIEQTTGRLFAQPRLTVAADPDIVIMVRKIWDIGLEHVRLQTVIQVDGDVLVRAAPEPGDDLRDFYAALHRSAVTTAITQWQSLFALARALLDGLGRTLLGRA